MHTAQGLQQVQRAGRVTSISEKPGERVEPPGRRYLGERLRDAAAGSRTFDFGIARAAWTIHGIVRGDQDGGIRRARWGPRATPIVVLDTVDEGHRKRLVGTVEEEDHPGAVDPRIGGADDPTVFLIDAVGGRGGRGCCRQHRHGDHQRCRAICLHRVSPSPARPARWLHRIPTTV